MTTLAPASEEALHSFAPVFAFVEQAMGFVPNSLKVMARNPALLHGFISLSQALMGPEARLDPGLRALISHMASRSAGCRYCQAHTAHTAERAGVVTEKIEQIWSYETSPLFSAAERAALAVAQAAGSVPNMVDPEDIETLKAHFSENEVIEIVGVISLFGFLNRWNDTLATPLEAQPAAFAETHLAQGGWAAGKHRE